MQILNGFQEIFFQCCCSNLNNDDIISYSPGLKIGRDFGGHV